MKYKVDFTNKFKKQHKKLIKQGKDLTKLYTVIEQLANKETLEPKYKDHPLIDDKIYKTAENAIYPQIGYLYTDMKKKILYYYYLLLVVILIYFKSTLLWCF